MSKKDLHVLHIAQIDHIRDGKVIWRDENLHNMLHDQGEQYILARSFAQNMPNYNVAYDTLYLGLDTRTAAMTEADTMATLVENAFISGYERKALSAIGTGASGQDFYITQPAAYYQAQSKVVEWICGANWVTPVTRVFLTTSATGKDAIADKLICTIALSATRTLISGDTLKCAIYVGLSE